MHVVVYTGTSFISELHGTAQRVHFIGCGVILAMQLLQRILYNATYRNFYLNCVKLL